MAIFTCPHCGHEKGVPNDFVGKSVICPKCNGRTVICRVKDHPDFLDELAIDLPKPVIEIDDDPEEFLPMPTPPAIPTEKHCPMCGEAVLYVAKKCKHCGEYLDGQVRSSITPGIAAAVSVFMPGVGFMLLGHVGAGVCWLFGTIIMYATFGPFGLIVHIACIIATAGTEPA